ncbi:GAF domain-containing protein [Dyadobacter luticola]|uniref:GAF domain-containing protein n=2 Tax=Dyadobacter luticola TaxID=1979387 RepID=A0A5R9L6W7_9BACT|nr:GAF domain-containing protein [Dyadobacter luticola]
MLLLLLPLFASSQSIFQNIKWQDGLSAKQVRCLYKDAAGFLWIGTTNGLNRFDGAVVKRYKGDPSQKNMFINAIHPVEGEGKLLVGLSKGVLVFDKKNATFSTDNRFDLLKKLNVVTIKSDPTGRLWIGTTSRIFIFEAGKLYPIAALIPAATMFASDNYYLSRIVPDIARHGVWIAGTKPYFIDYQTKQVFSKENNVLKSPVLEVNNVHALAVDQQDNVWFGCDDDLSLNFWDLKTKSVQKYQSLDGKKINEGCNHLFVDSKNRLWISTWLFAAFVKEPGKPIKIIKYSQNRAYTIGYGHFRDAIEDKEGNVWLGTINGVSKSQANYPLIAIYELPSFKFFLETGFAHANFIRVDSNRIVACKEDGVVIYNTLNGSYKHYSVSDKELIRNRFLMAAKADNKLWFSGNDGVHYLDNRTDKLVRFEDIKKGLPERFASFIFTDHLGKVWFQIVNDAIYCYDPATQKTERFDGKDPEHGLFDLGYCQSFVPQSNHDIVFALEKKGLLRYHYDTKKFTTITSRAVKEMEISRMVGGKNGIIWAAVLGRGILRITPEGEVMDSVNSGNGLFYDYITGIAVDQKGAVWGSSREGLMFFNPVTRAVTKVDIDLGKTMQDYFNFVTVAGGKVYAIMLDHIVVIDPLRFAGIPVKKPPHITSVQVLGVEKINQQKGNVLELEPDEDFITFQYASLNHRDIPSLQYSYQLEGIDKGWVNAARSITASYTNLLPGTYTFKVRSTDQYGAWMQSARKLEVVVKPHWWQTWWFLTFCSLVVIFLLFFSYRSYIKRKQKKRFDNTIDYFANSVYGENSVTEICWDIARNCISQMLFEDCVVYLMDESRNMLVQQAAYGPKNPKGFEIVNPIEIPLGKGIVGTVAATGKPLVIGDTSKDSRYVVDDQTRLSEIAVPILHEGKVIGVIDSEHTYRHFFSEKHLKTLTTVAAISANKIAEALAKSNAQRQELVVLEIQKMLAESQLMALRAQMNPHFVFNCLNSIQECIVTKKYGEASKYLNKFSKLFRMVLNNSGKKLVSLEEERQVLELYLELELMRFGQSFSYEIIVDPRLDENQILLPSMLLQPYVENALWHGLMAKDGPRMMVVEFKMISDDAFLCRIDDNGIGREKSFEIKAQNSKPKSHKSLGLSISNDRINILSMQGNHASVRIIDKYDPGGKSAGTLVEVELSTYLKTP